MFGMVKTTIWCERGCKNHIFSGTVICPIWDSILGGAGGRGWASGEGDSYSYIKLVLEDDD